LAGGPNGLITKQMQLALEDIETTIAEQDAQEDNKETAEPPADAQRKEASCQPRIAAGSSPSHPRHARAREYRLSVLSWHDAHHAGGYGRASRRNPPPISGDRDASSPIWLPSLRTGRGPAPAAERLIKGGLPTEGMVASVLGCQICLAFTALPTSPDAAEPRHRDRTRDPGILGGLCGAELKPLYLRLRELILGSAKIAVDETVAPVLDPGRGRTKKGYFWAIARDDRPWGGIDPPAVAYTYAPAAAPSTD